MQLNNCQYQLLQVFKICIVCSGKVMIARKTLGSIEVLKNNKKLLRPESETPWRMSRSTFFFKASALYADASISRFVHICV